MPIQGLDISLNVRNNTNYPQQINVLGNPANLLDTANATTEYRYDLTSFTFTTENSITIQYKIVGEPSFQTYTQLLDGQNLQAVQSAINNLGIGYFNLYEELGQTYLGSYNDKYEFGDLEIFDSNGAPITTTTTTTTTTIAPTTSTTTTTTTLAPTTTSTTSTTTTSAPTTTTSTTTTSTTLAVYTYALGVDSISGNGACLDFTIAPINYYSSSSSLGNGVVLYQDIALSTLVPNNYYADGIQNWLVTSGNGTLTTETLCSLTTSTTTTTTTLAPTTTSTTTTTTTLAPTTTSTTTTTTTIAFSTYSLQASAIDQADACAQWPVDVNDYYTSFGASLTDGTTIYTDTTLLTPALDGYYSNGTLSWATTGGNGVLTNESACVTPTTSTTTSTTTLAPTTSTTTTTTTAAPVYAFCLGYDASSQPAACADFSTCNPAIIEVYFNNGVSGDTINDVKFNGVSVTPFSGSFPMTPSISFLQAYVYNYAVNGTLEVYENITSSSIQTTITDSVSSNQCQNPASGNLFYQIYNVTTNTSLNSILTVDVTGGTC